MRDATAKFNVLLKVVHPYAAIDQNSLVATAASPTSTLLSQIGLSTLLPELAMQPGRALREFLWLGHHDDAIALAEDQQLVACLEAESFARSLGNDHLILAAELDCRVHNGSLGKAIHIIHSATSMDCPHCLHRRDQPSSTPQLHPAAHHVPTCITLPNPSRALDGMGMGSGALGANPMSGLSSSR